MDFEGQKMEPKDGKRLLSGPQGDSVATPGCADGGRVHCQKHQKGPLTPPDESTQGQQEDGPVRKSAASHPGSSPHRTAISAVSQLACENILTL